MKFIFMECFGPYTFVVGLIPMHRFNPYYVASIMCSHRTNISKVAVLCLRACVAADISAYVDLTDNTLHIFVVIGYSVAIFALKCSYSEVSTMYIYSL